MFCFHKGMVNLREATVGTSVETIHESCLLADDVFGGSEGKKDVTLSQNYLNRQASQMGVALRGR